jgi:hypothetical protein
VAGSFAVPSFDAGVAATIIDPTTNASFRAGSDAAQGQKWRDSGSQGIVFDFQKMKLDGPMDQAVAYLSFWVYSTKQLDNFLAESNLPKLTLVAHCDDGAEIWLNGKSIGKSSHRGPLESNSFTIPNVLLQKGWNHFLVKVVQDTGRWEFSARFTCDQPEYLDSLNSALEKPAGD